MAAAAVLMVAMGVAAVVAKADVWDKKTILTVNQPIQVENTFLEPGTYVLKLLDSSSNRHIVQIFNRDQSQLINTVLAIPNYRLQPTGDSQFTFYETPEGYARAMRAWFYPGDNFGQEFRYPKELRQIAMAQVTHQTTQQTEQTVETETKTTETTELQERNTVETEQQAEERHEVAQVEPQEQPQPQAEPQPEPQPEAQPTPAPVEDKPSALDQPTELPKTGTMFPLVGLGGLLSLAGYGLLRMKRS